MKRIWSVEEGVIEDPNTKLRLEFSSVHSDEVNAGNEPPANDDTVVLRLWTSDRSRVAIFRFSRNGRLIRSDIEAIEQPAIGGSVPDLTPGEDQKGEPQITKQDIAAVAREIEKSAKALQSP